MPHLPRLAELCLLAPMRAFGDRPLVALVDPLRVRPDALARLAHESGPALTTSPHVAAQGGVAAARDVELPGSDGARAGA